MILLSRSIRTRRSTIPIVPSSPVVGKDVVGGIVFGNNRIQKRYDRGMIGRRHLTNQCSTATSSCKTTFAKSNQATTSTTMTSRGGVRRSLVSSSDGSNNNKLKTVWERQAVVVKDTENEKSKYLETIRAEHDPSLHLKTIEDELLGTIGKALGKQGDKIAYAMHCMKKEYTKYEQILQQIQQNNTTNPTLQKQLIAIAEQYNNYRKNAIQARWELLVHRQACGFTVNNHKVVYENYPIMEAIVIPTTEDDETNHVCNDNLVASNQPHSTATSKKSSFGSQLDWWEQIGRWK